MKEITLKVPDHKVDFVMQLIDQLGLEVSDQPEIPEEHKEIVRKRILKSSKDPDRLLDWDQVKDNFKFE